MHVQAYWIQPAPATPGPLGAALVAFSFASRSARSALTIGDGMNAPIILSRFLSKHAGSPRAGAPKLPFMR